jgi:CW_7 repeat
MAQENAPTVDQRNPPPPPEDPPEEMSNLTRTAHEVLHGAWSQGKYRQKLLIDAGYNPYEVQEEADRLKAEKEQ